MDAAEISVAVECADAVRNLIALRQRLGAIDAERESIVVAIEAALQELTRLGVQSE